jgi:hypothetical protein
LPLFNTSLSVVGSKCAGDDEGHDCLRLRLDGVTCHGHAVVSGVRASEVSSKRDCKLI